MKRDDFLEFVERVLTPAATDPTLPLLPWQVRLLDHVRSGKRVRIRKAGPASSSRDEEG